jgi:pyruvate/2-oxoglutarate dehydrogenase complex dihydrolipoamide acyltransferase (E2) component
MLSCAHWLSWRISLSPGAAREQVRVARRLEDLPRIAAAFADGRLSYSKVRAITRVAEPDDGIDWVELGHNASAGQLEKIVRGVRRAQFNEAAEADPEAAAWSLRTRLRYDDNGNFVLTITGRAELLPTVQAGLEAKKTELQRQRDAAEEAASEKAAGVEAAGVAAAGVEAVAAEPEPVAAEQLVAQQSPAGPSAADEADVDEQAPGWPPGTTGRQVRELTAGFFAAQQERRRATGCSRARSRGDA